MAVQRDPLTTPGPAGPLSLLGERDFLLLWLAGTCTGTNRWLEILAVGVFTYRETGSALLVALVITIRQAPMFLLGLFSGAIGERVDRKHLLCLGFALVAPMSLVLAWLAWSGALQLWHVCVGAFLVGVFFAVEFPFRRIMAGEVAGMERIGPAMALESATMNFTRMLGPGLGGALFELVGLYGAFLLAFALQVAGGLLVWMVRYEQPARPLIAPPILASIAEGLRFVRGRPVLMGTLAVTVAMNFFGFSYLSMVPVIGEEVLQLTALPIGLLMSAEGMGAFVGSLLSARYTRPEWFARIFFVGALTFMTAVLLFGLSPLFLLSLALLLAGGLGIAGFNSMQSAIMLSGAPPELRSRVMGVLTVCIGAGPFGMMQVGLLATAFGAQVAVVATAAAGLASLLAVALTWPQIHRPPEQ